MIEEKVVVLGILCMVHTTCSKQNLRKKGVVMGTLCTLFAYCMVAWWCTLHAVRKIWGKSGSFGYSTYITHYMVCTVCSKQNWFSLCVYCLVYAACSKQYLRKKWWFWVLYAWSILLGVYCMQKENLRKKGVVMGNLCTLFAYCIWCTLHAVREGFKKKEKKKWEFFYSGSGPPPPKSGKKYFIFFIWYMVSKKHFCAKTFFLHFFMVGTPSFGGECP